MITNLGLEFGLKVVATVGADILRNQYKGFAPKNCRPGTHADGTKTICFYEWLSIKCNLFRYCFWNFL